MYRNLFKRVGRYLLTYRTEAEVHNILTRDIPQGECVFRTLKPKPYIIDAGAHIGVMTLHFKSQYPDAKVVSFEPNPHTYQRLIDNIEGNGLRDVTAVNAALSDRAGDAILFGSEHEETRGNSISTHWGQRPAGQTQEMKIKTVKLSDYLDEPVDFLKLDVEGVEMNVLRECADKLRNVKELELEVHETEGCGFTLQDIRMHLITQGFVIKAEKTRNITMTLPVKWRSWALQNQPRLTVLRALNSVSIKK